MRTDSQGALYIVSSTRDRLNLTSLPVYHCISATWCLRPTIAAMIVGMLPSFLDRQGTETFREPSSVWGYLPQLNEWAGSKLEWFAERVGGKDHQPEFEAFPIYDGERLEVFKALGKSKKAAKEEAARLMCTSGHC
ncbi:hypothetical protein K466DRAFT_348820 [Polyporus arcularius HHB13444]|uniref:Uncharacterized protein n=1 Tax=Polyporus arcularius HHB13444 TaxID=1314778 RepID=A0A5C3NXS7_9APHY|nr:hypothetical protein K466DRAFT_348820 [Polyporus arcularius HHB13444]